MAKAAAPGSGAPAMSRRPQALAASSSSPMGQWGRRLCSRSRAALHEDLWPDARATGDGLGRAARMGGQEPARDPRAAVGLQPTGLSRGPGGPTPGTPITVEDVLN